MPRARIGGAASIVRSCKGLDHATLNSKDSTATINTRGTELPTSFNANSNAELTMVDSMHARDRNDVDVHARVHSRHYYCADATTEWTRATTSTVRGTQVATRGTAPMHARLGVCSLFPQVHVDSVQEFRGFQEVLVLQAADQIQTNDKEISSSGQDAKRLTSFRE